MGIQGSSSHKYVWEKRGFSLPKSKPLGNNGLNVMLAVSLDGIFECEFHLGDTSQLNLLVFFDHLLSKLKEIKLVSQRKCFLIMDNVNFHKTVLV